MVTLLMELGEDFSVGGKADTSTIDHNSDELVAQYIY
jgi:hypothetical protein